MIQAAFRSILPAVLAACAWAGPIVSFTNGSEAWWLLEADCATRDMVLVHSSPSLYTPRFRPPRIPAVEFDPRGEPSWNPFGPSTQVRIGAILGERRKRNPISLAPGEGVAIFAIPSAGRDGCEADTYSFELTDRNRKRGPAFAVTRDAAGHWTSNWEKINGTDRGMLQSALRWEGWSALINADVWTLGWNPFKDPGEEAGKRDTAGTPPAVPAASAVQAGPGLKGTAARPLCKRRSPWQWFQWIWGCELLDLDENE